MLPCGFADVSCLSVSDSSLICPALEVLERKCYLLAQSTRRLRLQPAVARAACLLLTVILVTLYAADLSSCAATGLPCPLPILSSAAAAAAAGSTPSSSRSSQIGTLTNHCGDMGMAYIKLAPALAAAAAAGKGDKGPQLQVQLEGGAVQQVVPQRPEWWPAEWGIEEAGPAAGSSSS